MTYATYSDEIKAQVMAALLAGQSINAVAKEYKIPPGTISYWRAQASEFIQENRSKNGIRLDQLLSDYLEASLTTLRVQAEFFRTETWLERQEASQLAVLYGVVSDKAIRILEAYAGEPEDDA